MKENGTPETLPELMEKLKQDGATKEEQLKETSRFLEMKARRDGLPLHGTLELTPLCNLDCRMCYVHLSRKQYDEKKLLPAKTWADLVSQAREQGLLRISLSGGECLTYPGFDELYLYLYSRGIRTRVLSNGLLMDEKRVDFFRKYPPEGIQITLYGYDEDSYEAVTGRRVFRRIEENLIRLRDAGLPVHMTLTPNGYMKGNLRQLPEKAEELKIPWQINAMLIPPRPGTGRSRHDLKAEDYIELYKIRNEFRGAHFEPADPAEIPDPAETGEPGKGVRCGAGRSSFTIRYDGMMSPCTGLDGILTRPLEAGFKAAWAELSQRAMDYPVPGECGECVYREACILCPALHKEAPAGHCDRRICERTRMMAEAGLIRKKAEQSSADAAERA